MSDEVKIEGNTDIDQALKEFEMKSQAEEAQKTPKVSKPDDEMPRMVKLVIKLSGGAIKEQRQAEYVLLGLVVVMFALSFYFFFGGTKKTVPASVRTDTIDQSQFVQ